MDWKAQPKIPKYTFYALSFDRLYVCLIFFICMWRVLNKYLCRYNLITQSVKLTDNIQCWVLCLQCLFLSYPSIYIPLWVGMCVILKSSYLFLLVGYTRSIPSIHNPKYWLSFNRFILIWLKMGTTWAGEKCYCFKPHS